MLPLDHSAILLTCIKRLLVLKTNFGVFLKWLFYTLYLFLKDKLTSNLYHTVFHPHNENILIGPIKQIFSQGFFFAILGRGPCAFQIGKSSIVNPSIGKFVIVHNIVIFVQ